MSVHLCVLELIHHETWRSMQFNTRDIEVTSLTNMVDQRNIIFTNMYLLEWRTVSAPTRGLFWCLFPELRNNEENNTKNNTRVSAETVRHESTYVILFQTWHNDSINDDKNDDLYTSPPCLIRSVFVLLMTSQPPGLEATVFVDIIAINRGAEYE